MLERLPEIQESTNHVYPEYFRSSFLKSAKLAISARKRVDKATQDYQEGVGNPDYHYGDKLQLSRARQSAVDEFAAHVAVNSFDLVAAIHDYEKNGPEYVEQAITEAETSGIIITLEQNP
jgi:hypothetical protein